jgi:hypothetical protein
MAGCSAGNFQYTAISAITLQAGTKYYLTSQETNGGDSFYDQGYDSTATSVTLAAVATIAGAPNSTGVWSLQAPPAGNPNDTYGPVSLLYATGSSGGGGGTTAAPVVTITSPTASSALAGSGTATVSVTPASGLTFSVQFQLDGVNLGSAGTT